MTRTRTRQSIAGAALAVLALSAPAAAQAAPPKLVAAVGPGFTISLKTAAGKNVTALERGTYAITVSDRSRSHDFRLRGPGLNRALTGVGEVGTKTVTVRVAPGRYQFVCQPHASAMRGAFRVG